MKARHNRPKRTGKPDISRNKTLDTCPVIVYLIGKKDTQRKGLKMNFTYRGVDFREVDEILSRRGEADVEVRMKDGSERTIAGNCGDGNFDRASFELARAKKDGGAPEPKRFEATQNDFGAVPDLTKVQRRAIEAFEALKATNERRESVQGLKPIQQMPFLVPGEGWFVVKTTGRVFPQGWPNETCFFIPTAPGLRAYWLEVTGRQAEMGVI
jgi:hypothetical protein